MLDDVQCTGWENKLLACRSAPLLKVSSNCNHFDDAGVRCEGIHIDCHEQYTIDSVVNNAFLKSSFHYACTDT